MACIGTSYCYRKNHEPLHLEFLYSAPKFGSENVNDQRRFLAHYIEVIQNSAGRYEQFFSLER